MKAQEQIEKLRSLQESFDNLANTYNKLATTSAIGVEAELQQGKQSLVSAIEYKGGESSADKSLQGIAEDIKEIPNFDQWVRLAGVLAGIPATDSLSGHNQNVEAGSITEIIDNVGIFKVLKSSCFSYWDLLKRVEMPALTKVNNNCFMYCIALKYVDFSSLTTISRSVFHSCAALQDMRFGSLLQIDEIFYIKVHRLRNITIGKDTNINLPFQNWAASYVIAEGQSGIDELNNNLRTNLLEKLYDHSTDGQTRTLRLGWLAHVTQDNIDYANSKGWTLTT